MMIDTLQANWMIFAAAALAVLLVVWWLISRAGGSRRDREYQPDVLDEGQGPAQRNQALIDAAPAAAVVLPPIMSDALGGMGEVVAMAAQAQVERNTAQAAEPEVPAPIEAPPPPPAPIEAPPSQPDTVPAPSTEPEIAPAAPEPEAEPYAPEPAQQPQPEAVEVAATQPEPGDPPAQVPQPEPQPSQPDPGPAPGPEPMPEQPTGGADDLGRIKGLGPKLQTLLPALGLTSFAQIAALSETDLAALDPRLGPFAGRPSRDGWVEQAKYLAAGDVAGFEARFGKV